MFSLSLSLSLSLLSCLCTPIKSFYKSHIYSSITTPIIILPGQLWFTAPEDFRNTVHSTCIQHLYYIACRCQAFAFYIHNCCLIWVSHIKCFAIKWKNKYVCLCWKTFVSASRRIEDILMPGCKTTRTRFILSSSIYIPLVRTSHYISTSATVEIAVAPRTA